MLSDELMNPAHGRRARIATGPQPRYEAWVVVDELPEFGRGDPRFLQKALNLFEDVIVHGRTL